MSQALAVGLITGVGVAGALGVVLLVLLRLARRSLSRLQRHSDEFLESMQDLVYETDEEDVVVSCNGAFARVFGCASSAEVVGRCICDFYVDAAHRELLKRELKARGGSVTDYVILAKRESGAAFYLSVDSSLIEGADGSARVRGVGKDVTGRISMYGGFYQLSSQDVITFCDRVFSEAFGYSSPAELIGRTVSEALQVHQALRRRAHDRLRRRPSETQQQSFAAVRKDGQLVYARVDARGLPDSRGLYRSTEGVLKDIHPAGIYVIQDGCFRAVDSQVCTLLGRSERELVGQPFLDIISPVDRELARREVDRKLQGGYGRVYELRLIHKLGHEVFAVCDSAPHIYDRRPAVTGYFALISHEKAVQERLKRREQFSAMGEAAADMAHFLGNKLSPLVRSASRLRKVVDGLPVAADLRSSMIEDLDLIQSSAQRMVQAKDDLIPRVLDVAAIETTLLRLCGEAVTSLDMPDNIAVTIQLDPAIPPTKRHPRQLLRVITYIVKNAVEAMPGGGELAIAGAYDAANDTVTLTFRDTGEGIPEELKQYVFKPFFSTKDSTSEGGAGLGLWFCLQALERMGATIGFESELAIGTTVEIVFYRYTKEV